MKGRMKAFQRVILTSTLMMVVIVGLILTYGTLSTQNSAALTRFRVIGHDEVVSGEDGFAVYVDDKYGFSFSYPKDWISEKGRQVDSSNQIWETRVISPLEDRVFIVTVQPVDERFTSSRSWADYLAYKQGKINTQDLDNRIVSETSIEIGGVDATVVEYEAGLGYSITYTYLVHEGLGYQLVMDSGQEWIDGNSMLTAEFVEQSDLISDLIVKNFNVGNSAPFQEKTTQNESGSPMMANSFRWPLDGGSIMRSYRYSVYFSSSWCSSDPSNLYHTAEDWSASIGTEVKAVANGVVAWYDPNRSTYPGRVVIIRHTLSSGSVIYSMYAHLATVSVQQDQTVSEGSVIGTVMDYPQQSPEHLHWEMRNFLDGTKVCSHPHYAGPGYTKEAPENYGYTNPSAFVQSHPDIGGGCCGCSALALLASDTFASTPLVWPFSGASNITRPAAVYDSSRVEKQTALEQANHGSAQPVSSGAIQAVTSAQYVDSISEPYGISSSFVDQIQKDSPVDANRYRTQIVGNSTGNTNASLYARQFLIDVTPPIWPPMANLEALPWHNDPTPPRLSWAAAKDENSGMGGYRVYWGDDPAGVDDATVAEPAFSPPAQMGANGAAIYYLRVAPVDVAGNQGEWRTTTIWQYDSASPAVALQVNGSPIARSLNASLSLIAADIGSGVASMRFSPDGVSWTGWEPYVSQRGWTLADRPDAQAVYAQVRDAAGNLSPTVQGSIRVELNAPQPASADFRLVRSVFAMSGGVKTSPSYRVQGTYGQMKGVGRLQGGAYLVNSGYWSPVPAAPALRVHKGDSSAALTWTNSGGSVIRYEVYRGTSPYLVPGSADAAKLVDAPPPAVGQEGSYEDATAFDLPLTNYFYAVRIVDLNGQPISNRSGTFNFALQPGAP